MLEDLIAPPCPSTISYPRISRKHRAEVTRAIRTSNRGVNDILTAVRREFVSVDWKQQSRAAIVSQLTSAIQSVDGSSVDLLNKAARTIIQEIYAIDRWPTSKRNVQARATSAIRRLKL